MRWPADSALAAGLALAATVSTFAACDSGEQASQHQAGLSCSVGYEDFAGPFLLNWCVGCHSSKLPEGRRQGAPLGVDFDTLEAVRARAELARFRVVHDQSMPPVGGPTPEERRLFGEWIDCGMPANGSGFVPPAPDRAPEVPPLPSGACAEPRTALPDAALPRCQASTLDCVVACGADGGGYDADACRNACLAADGTPTTTVSGLVVDCPTCTLTQLLACTDRDGCHDETARFLCCVEGCAGVESCTRTRCGGELAALGLCAYYVAPQCLSYTAGPMSACFAESDGSGGGGGEGGGEGDGEGGAAGLGGANGQ